MKGGIELSLVLSFTMMLLMVSISIVGGMISYNNARFVQEKIVSIVEYHNKYDRDVEIDISNKIRCQKCTFSIVEANMNRYQVTVAFPITILFAQLKMQGHVSGYTVPVS